jgi:hypothetical protein
MKKRKHGLRMEKVMPRVRDAGWPSTPEDVRIVDASQMKLDREPFLFSHLAAVPAMMPQLRALLLNVRTYASISSELTALSMLMQSRGHRILPQKVALVTLELGNEWHSDSMGRWEVDYLSKNICALLSRAKAGGSAPAIVVNFRGAEAENELRMRTISNAKVLFVFKPKSGTPLLDLIIFSTTLLSLELEHSGSILGEWSLRQRLVTHIATLSHSLERLVLLTGIEANGRVEVEYTDENLWGLGTGTDNQRSHDGHGPLIPSLARISKLKHLTIEPIWLLGTRDLFTADRPRLQHMLPASLETLCLCDFWGESGAEEYYEVPNMSAVMAVDLYSDILGELAACTITHPKKLSSHLYAVEDRGNNALVKVGVEGREKTVLEDISVLKDQCSRLSASYPVSFSVVSCSFMRDE